MEEDPHRTDARRLWPVALGLVVVTASLAGSVGYWARGSRHGDPAPAASRQIASAGVASALKRPLQTKIPPPTIQRMTQDAYLPPLPAESPSGTTAEAEPAEPVPPEARPTEPPTPVAAAPREEAPAARSAEAQPPPGPPATTGSVGEPSNVAVENGAPLDCLPPRMREILKAISTEYGRVSVVSTTTVNTGNHNKAREKLHHDCLAVDFRVDNADPKVVLAFLRLQPGMGGLGHYKNGVIHMDDASAHPPGAYDRD